MKVSTPDVFVISILDGVGELIVANVAGGGLVGYGAVGVEADLSVLGRLENNQATGVKGAVGVALVF